MRHLLGLRVSRSLLRSAGEWTPLCFLGFLVVLGGFLPGCGRAEVETLRAEVVAEYPHARESFTQGLLWHEGALFESTGQYGDSSVRRVDLATGEALLSERLPDELFGEGLARVGDRLIQITWREEQARIYNLATLEWIESLPYEGEGWGLCFDGQRLVMSNGSSQLTFRDPKSLEPLGQVQVTLHDKPVTRLNELECVDGAVYANVFGTEQLVKIDPSSGEVSALIDASGLLPVMLSQNTDVMNGVAYRRESETFFLTGKYWPRLFEVRFVPKNE